jgi:hypothetical protein
MAPPKKRGKLSRSAKFYRDNPEARDKKKKKDKEVNSRPEQVKKRVEANRHRRKAKAAGKNVEGKDAAHTKSGMRLKSSSANRGSKSDSPGDKRARGKKKK